MSKELYILGAGSVGGYLAYNLSGISSDYKIAGFFDDDPAKKNSTVFGYPVLGGVDDLLTLKDVSVVIGIAFPSVKARLYEKLKQNSSIEYPSLIAGNAWISANCKIGKGVIIYPGCSINYNTSIGDFVVMNMNCAIGHDCTIGDFTSLAPSVSLGGRTSIGSLTEMGIATATKQGVKIGSSTVLGGNSMVIADIPDHVTAVGVPARIIK
ncbi:MAG TPA: NeuD/PglB/VioB family sugar acetyltransferase [Flavihumibacter sp.]|jgi:sugar O-acyltransferase (sialic acid O-acetyltransferase NeuD family)